MNESFRNSQALFLWSTAGVAAFIACAPHPHRLDRRRSHRPVCLVRSGGARRRYRRRLRRGVGTRSGDPDAAAGQPLSAGARRPPGRQRCGHGNADRRGRGPLLETFWQRSRLEASGAPIVPMPRSANRRVRVVNKRIQILNIVYGAPTAPFGWEASQGHAGPRFCGSTGVVHQARHVFRLEITDEPYDFGLEFKGLTYPWWTRASSRLSRQNSDQWRVVALAHQSRS
jgi:hypothetical protein